MIRVEPENLNPRDAMGTFKRHVFASNANHAEYDVCTHGNVNVLFVCVSLTVEESWY